MPRLAGKRALITGGTSGIGLETARQFLAEGAHVAVTGRSQEGLKQVEREFGGSVLTFRSDAGDVEDQEKLAARLLGVWPQIDILMCNAADITHRPIEKWDPQAFDAMIATNIKGPFFLIRALLPLFSRSSSIILVGSVSGLIGHRLSTVYGASKAGLMYMARGLSYELKGRGIRVNSLSPGPTMTGALKFLGPEKEAAVREQLNTQVPIGRMGHATELAKAAVYLASDESAFTVGTVLRVDGGLGELIDAGIA